MVSFKFALAGNKFPDGSYRKTYLDEGFYPSSTDMFSPMGRVNARFFRAPNAKREIAFRVMEYFDQTDKKQRERSFADEAMTRPLFDYFYDIDGQLIKTVDLSSEGTGVTINYTVAQDSAAVSVQDDKIGLSFNRIDGVISYTDRIDQSMSCETHPSDARYLYFASLAEDKLWHALKQAKGTADETRIRTAYQTLYDEARKFFPLDTGKDIWLGVNYMGPLGAQSYGQDFGSTAWYPNGNGISAHAGTVASDLEKMVSQRISRLRMWLICDGRALLDENSKVVGYNALYRKDIKALLDTAHAKGLRLELSLFDFYIADTGQWNNGVYMGGRKELFTDAGVRKKFINDFFVPFIKEFGRHPALQTIDLGNEMGFVQDLGVDPIPLLKELAIQIRKYAPHLKITINLRTDQVQDFSGLMPQIDFLAVHSYPDVTPSLDDIKGYLDGLSIPWGLGEVPSANPESSILDYYKEGVDKKAWYMSPWNWNPDLDDACFPDAATRDAAFEEIRQWNILRNTPVPQGVAKADVTAPAAEIPAHAFRPVSFYSIIGLGGGVDWTVYGTAGAAWMTISAISHWQSGISAFFLLFGALVAAVLATTAAIRVYRSVSAIRAAHTDFSLWRALTHDIGHDMTALAILRNTAPNVWFDIQSHESYGYHVPGLLAFIPSVHSNKRVSRMDAYLKDIRTKRETGGSDAGVSPDRTTEIRDILGKIPAAANANAAPEREAAFRELENKARSLLVEPQVLYSGANVEVVTNAGRLDIVPDIHADYDALIEHLKARGLISIVENGAIVFNITRGDVIVFQGDITGRGTQDVEVIQLLMRFKAEAASVGARAVFAEGNHDYYLRLLFRRISEIHDKGERVDLERAQAELNKILFSMGASSMISGVEGFLNRLYRAYRPNDLQGKFKSLRYGDFYAAYSGMIAGGVIDHYNDLKRLVVVDNHVITHTLLPSSVDNYLKRLEFDPGKRVDKKEFICELGVLDAYLGDLYDKQLANFSKEEGGFGPEAAWLYYTKVVRRGAPDEMRAIRDRLYSFLRRGLPLSPDVPFRMFIGHDPDLKAVTQDNERSGGKDLVLCDGGMSKCFRDRGMNGGIVEVSPLGKVIAHQPLRQEGKEAAVVVFETASDKASELMPSENADVQRLIARIREGRNRPASPVTPDDARTPALSSPAAPEIIAAEDKDETVIPDRLIIPIPVEPEQPVLTDFKQPKALAHNTIAVMLSVALSGKRPVLAFHKDVSGKSEGAIKTLLGRLEDLKNKEGFDKILNNMVIIKSFDSADDLRKQLGDEYIEADNEDNAIFTFSPAEGKSIEAKAVHDVVINEGEAFNADIYYYPLFEIVTMALVKYLRQYNPEQLKSILARLNITAEDINISDIVEDGKAFLVFRLVPKAERMRDGADRYALLRRYISSAA